MCYSANASFSASAVLAAMGIFLLVRVQNKRYVPLALMPLFFGIQQFAEGLLWLGIAPTWSKNIFLMFAFVGWPLWTPFSFWYAEKSPRSKQALCLFLGIGFVTALLLGIAIPHMAASTALSSIQYVFPPQFQQAGILLFSYCVATLLPFFVSTLPRTSLLGLVFASSALLILWIDRTFFVSLWCFVSALISLGLFFILKPQRQ